MRERREIIIQLTKLEKITLNNKSINTRAVLKMLCGEEARTLLKINLQYLETSRLYDQNLIELDNRVRKMGKIMKICIRIDLANKFKSHYKQKKQLTNKNCHVPKCHK